MDGIPTLFRKLFTSVNAIGGLATALTAISELALGDVTGAIELVGDAASCRTKAKAPRCSCGRCGGSSFPAGTEVLTPEGKVAIETLREGDLVIARDEETGVSGVFPVTALMSRQAVDTLWLTLARAGGTTTRMGVTSEHPLFVTGEGWVPAGELAPGDQIRDAAFRALTVLTVKWDPAPRIVHNLEVAGAHTYFAGELEAWGHNQRAPGPKRRNCNGKGSRYVPVWLKKWAAENGPADVRGFFQQQRNKGLPWSKIGTPPGYDWGHAPDNPFCEGGKHGGGSGLERPTDNRGRGGRTGN